MTGSHSSLRDERGFVTSFVIRLVLAFVLLALLVEEVGQVVVTQVRADGAARAGAVAGADTYFATKNQTDALDAAESAVGMKDARAHVVAFSISPDGMVTVTTAETAGTFVMQRIPFLKKARVQHATEAEGRTTL